MPMLRRRGGTRMPLLRRRDTTSPPIAIVPDGRMLEAGDAAQRRGLAAARRPEQHDDLARRDAEAHVVHGRDGRWRTPCAAVRLSIPRTCFRLPFTRTGGEGRPRSYCR